LDARILEQVLIKISSLNLTVEFFKTNKIISKSYNQPFIFKGLTIDEMVRVTTFFSFFWLVASD